MRSGIVLISEQLQTTEMCLRGLYDHYCEEGGVDGSSPELEAKIVAVKEADDAVRKAKAAIARLGAV